MKKIKIMFAIALICVATFGTSEALAALIIKGNARVHYRDSELYENYSAVYRASYMLGYNAYGCQNCGNASALNQLSTDKIFVIHHHGAAGLIQMGNNSFLSGTGGNGGSVKSVSSLASSAADNLTIAIYYGCDTGSYSATYGDIVLETVNKGATTAVAWKTLLIVDHTNLWHQLFFDASASKNIVERYRHADYWLRDELGDTAGDNMQLYRNERGNIYAYI